MKSGQIAIIKLCFISRMTAAVWHAARTEKIFEQTAAEKAAAALRHVTWESAEKGAPFSDLWPRARLGIVEELFAGDGNKDDVTDRVKQVQLPDSAAAAAWRRIFNSALKSVDYMSIDESTNCQSWEREQFTVSIQCQECLPML